MKGIQKFYHKTKLYLKRSSPTILTYVSIAGVVVTTVMAVKSTPKAIRLIDKATDEKGEDLTKLEVVKIAGPVYIPAVISGFTTITCILGANVLNKKQQAALSSAYAFLDNTYKEYKDKVKELFGDEAEPTVRKALMQDKYDKEQPCVSGDKQLFYEEYYGKYFELTKEEVLLAEYHFNRNFALRGYANLNEFYEFLGLEKTEIGEVLGWDIYAGEETYGYSWIDFQHEFVTMEDGLQCCVITMPFAPHPYYDND